MKIEVRTKCTRRSRRTKTAQTAQIYIVLEFEHRVVRRTNLYPHHIPIYGSNLNPSFIYFLLCAQSQSQLKNAHLSNDCVLSMRLSIILKVWIVDIMLEHTHTQHTCGVKRHIRFWSMGYFDSFGNALVLCNSMLFGWICPCVKLFDSYFLSVRLFLCNIFRFVFQPNCWTTRVLLFQSNSMDSFPLRYYKIFESWEILLHMFSFQNCAWVCESIPQFWNVKLFLYLNLSPSSLHRRQFFFFQLQFDLVGAG